MDGELLNESNAVSQEGPPAHDSQPGGSTPLPADNDMESLEKEDVLELEAFIDRKQWIQEQIKVSWHNKGPRCVSLTLSSCD